MQTGSKGKILVDDGSKGIFTFNFSVLFGAVFFLFFALDFYIPVIPFYVVAGGGKEAAVGLLMSLFTVCSVILRPMQGRNLNRRGRKKLLVAGIAVYAVGALGLMFTPGLTLLFVIRAIQGFGWGAFLLAFNTLTLDLAPEGRSGEALGFMGVAPTLSLAMAPLLGEHFRQVTGQNYPVLFFVAFIATMLALVMALLIRENSGNVTGEEIQGPLISSRVLVPSLFIFFMTFNLGCILTFLPLLGEVRDIRAVGYFFMVFAFTAAVFRPLGGKLSDRLDRRRVFLPALVLASFSLVLIAFSFDSFQLVFSAFLLGVGFGAAHASILGMVADRLPVVERGVGMATFTASFDLGIVAGAGVVGLLLRVIDFKAVFILCALIMLFPVILFFLHGINTTFRPATGRRQ